MNILKRTLLVLTAAAMTLSFSGCSDKETAESTSGTSAAENAETTEAAEDTTEAATEQETVQAPIPQEYNGAEVPDAAAQVISDYFTAIMNQDYNGYKDTLDPFYFEVYNNWLDGTFGYGMETSFETMHQSMMDSAVTANGGDAVTEMTVTRISLKETVLQEGEDMDTLIDDYLSQYDSIIGEGFTEGLREQCDDVVNVTFTMTADCDGKELEIMTDMEILLTVHGDEYKVMG